MRIRWSTVPALLSLALGLLVLPVAVEAPPAGAAGGGTPWTVGDGSQGQLGAGSTARGSAFAPVTGLTDAVQVAGGRDHVLALDSSGTVWAWGDGSKGALGLGSTADRLTPTPVPGLTAKAVAAGHYHSLALLADGTVRAWGFNSLGQLGDGTTTRRTSPVRVSGLSGVQQVAGGRDMSYALLSDGTVQAWGSNAHGELGDGTTAQRRTPVHVRGLTDVRQVAAGRNHGIAVTSDGAVWTWGQNDSGQLGDGTRTNRTLPVQVPGITDAVAVVAGAAHSVALLADGSVLTWGEGSRGELGSGGTADRLKPGVVQGVPAAASVDAGRDHTLVVTRTGQVWTWGFDDYGQVGDGATANRLSPYHVPGIDDAVGAGGGRGYSVLLRGASVPAPDAQPPSAPGKPSATSTVPGRVDLAWAASTDDVARTLTYRVYRDTGAQPVGTVSSGSTGTVAYSDTGLVAGSVHRYTVTASDGVHTSAASPGSDPVTVAGGGPTVVLSDGFSSGLGAWTVDGMTLDPTRAPPGGSAPSVLGAPVGAAAVMTRQLPATEPAACVTAAVRVDKGPPAAGMASALLRLTAAGGKGIAKATVDRTGALRLVAEPAGVTSVAPTGLVLGQWATLQLCAVTGSTGGVTLAVDGVPAGEWSGALGAQPVGRVQLGETGKRNTVVGYDDVVVTGRR